VIGPVFHDLARLRAGLLSTERPVVLDVETTGLDVLRDRILSYGFRLSVNHRYENHILFTSCCTHATIQPYVSNDASIRESLGALDRPDLILVGHNIKFDLLMLRREGTLYNGAVRDTLGMLRLIDQDRGFTDETAGRRDLRAPAGSEWLNYRLKNVAAQFFGVKPLFTPATNMRLVPYREHAIYLAHDLYITHRLHDYLWQGLPSSLRWHWTDVQSPLTHLLCKMRWDGVAGDPDFVHNETTRLDDLLRRISSQHHKQFNLPLFDLSDGALQELLYQKYELPCKRTRKGKPSTAADVIDGLIDRTKSEQIRSSLQLISAFRQVQSLRKRLADQERHLYPDRRYHSSFDNKQAAGRISSVEPNLQQIAGPKVILPGTPFETTIRSRNVVVASTGCVLVAADVAQADVRVLAHEIDRCEETTAQHRQRLLQERFARRPRSRELWESADAFRNSGWAGEAAPPITQFVPTDVSRLVRNFQISTGDFYSVVATEVSGRTIGKNDADRGLWKTILLAQINGESPTGLSRRLGCSVLEAAERVAAFFAAYPDIEGWVAMQRQQVALAGRTFTWLGRMRTNTAHRWMVDEAAQSPMPPRAAQPRAHHSLPVPEGKFCISPAAIKIKYVVRPVVPSLPVRIVRLVAPCHTDNPCLTLIVH
jgi:DNA polymerase I-like protein with 3'-5' exonuclease and polymerase domains